MALSKQRWITIAIVITVVVMVIIAVALFMFRPTYVPMLVGTPASEVASNVAEAGLQVGDSSQVATDAIGAGVVLEQRPAPGGRVPRRSSVDVTSSVAPQAATVPNVTMVVLPAALQTLTDALFVPITVDEFSKETSAGTVVEQFPASGADWRTGRPVAVGVSVGPDDGTAVKVPDLEGQTPEEVAVTLEKAGLMGDGLIRDLGEAEANTVVAQLPQAGTLVRAGSTVLMIFVLP